MWYFVSTDSIKATHTNITLRKSCGIFIWNMRSVRTLTVIVLSKTRRVHINLREQQNQFKTINGCSAISFRYCIRTFFADNTFRRRRRHRTRRCECAREITNNNNQKFIHTGRKKKKHGILSKDSFVRWCLSKTFISKWLKNALLQSLLLYFLCVFFWCTETRS